MSHRVHIALNKLIMSASKQFKPGLLTWLLAEWKVVMLAILWSPFFLVQLWKKCQSKKSITECWKSCGKEFLLWLKSKLSKSRLLKLFEETAMEIWSKSFILGVARRKEMKIQKTALESLKRLTSTRAFTDSLGLGSITYWEKWRGSTISALPSPSLVSRD